MVFGTSDLFFVLPSRELSRASPVRCSNLQVRLELQRCRYLRPMVPESRFVGPAVIYGLGPGKQFYFMFHFSLCRYLRPR
jgi:hypothetical protein